MDQTDEVFVVDTWNDGSPTRKNVLDPNQVRTGIWPRSQAAWEEATRSGNEGVILLHCWYGKGCSNQMFEH